jgi:hypothetical protein
MIKFYVRFTLCLTTFGIILLSTGIARAGNDWKPVSADELAMKSPMVEKDADAEALFWEVTADDSDPLQLALTNYVRIKIFTQRGRELLRKIDIPAEFGSRIKDVAARVIAPDGTITIVPKEDIFERTIVNFSGVKLKAKSFAVPGNAPGVIVEFRYREVYEYAGANMTLVLQREIPIQSMTFRIRPYNGLTAMHVLMFNVPDSEDFVNEGNDFRRLTVTKVLAVHSEPYMPPLNQIRPWVMLYYANEGGLAVDEYWKRNSIELYQLAKELLKPNDALKRTAAEVTNGVTSQEEKLARLYDFCQTKIKNLSTDAQMTEEEKNKAKLNYSAADTWNRKVGWGPDIDVLFAALVRASGMEAQISWTGDRDYRFFDRTNKSTRLIHPSAVAVKTDAGWRFFKPGARFVPFGMVNWNEEGLDTLIPTAEGADWVKAPIAGPDQSQERRTGKFKLTADGTLEGEVRIEYSGHLAYFRKNTNYDDSVAKQEETLRNEVRARLAAAELSEIRIENVNDPKAPFAYVFKVRVPGYAQATGKRLLLQPGFFANGTGKIFTTVDRRFDIFFHHAWSEQDDVAIELPPGFSVDSGETPAPITPEMTKGLCGLNIQMGLRPDQKTLVYRRSFFFGGQKELLFPAANYQALKDLFDSVRRADDQPVILRQP